MNSVKLLRELCADIFGCEPEDITMDTDFTEDLYADSMDAMELAIMLEEEFDLTGLTELDFSQYRTFGDVARALMEKTGELL